MLMAVSLATVGPAAGSSFRFRRCALALPKSERVKKRIFETKKSTAPLQIEESTTLYLDSHHIVIAPSRIKGL